MTAIATPSIEDHPAARAARLRRQAQDRSRRWRARKALDAAYMVEKAAEAEAMIGRARIDAAFIAALFRLHATLRGETGDPGVAIPFRDIVRVAREIIVEGGKSRDWASDTVRERLRLEALFATHRGFPGPVTETVPVSLSAQAE